MEGRLKGKSTVDLTNCSEDILPLEIYRTHVRMSTFWAPPGALKEGVIASAGL